MKDQTERVGTVESVSRFAGKGSLLERDVKDKVKKLIRSEHPNAHIFCPVQTGFGAPDLDFIVTVNGFALRIETKVDGKKPSARQLKTIADLDRADCPVLVIDQHNLDDLSSVLTLLKCDFGCMCYRQAFHASRESRQRYLDHK